MLKPKTIDNLQINADLRIIRGSDLTHLQESHSRLNCSLIGDSRFDEILYLLEESSHMTESNDTDQMKTWKGDFGQQYTDRNPQVAADVEALYNRNFGFSRTSINERFLSGVPKSFRILEVGCNVGTQLEVLSNMGFEHLYGIELQRYAVDIARKRLSSIDIIAGSIFDIPFKDGFFDLVFTSGVLIHISPETISTAIHELIRCSNRYIWGCEYFSEVTEEISYRGNNSLAWKTNFSRLLLGEDSSLILVKEEYLPYLQSDEIDVMYMLEKSTR